MFKNRIKLVERRSQLEILARNSFKYQFHDLQPKAQMLNAINNVCYGAKTRYLLTHNPLATAQGVVSIHNAPKNWQQIINVFPSFWHTKQSLKSCLLLYRCRFMLLISFYTREMNTDRIKKYICYFICARIKTIWFLQMATCGKCIRTLCS